MTGAAPRKTPQSSGPRIFIVRYRGSIAPHILEALGRAFAGLGCEVREKDLSALPFDDPAQGTALKTGIEALIAEIRGFRPHLAVSYGETGLVRVRRAAGKISNVFEEAQVPYAALFYDSPDPALPVLENYRGSPRFLLFCWDRRYIQRLEVLGFSNVFYLPLATDPDVFSPGTETEERQVCFVGASSRCDVERDLKSSPLLLHLARTALKRLEEDETLLNVGDVLARALESLTGSQRADWERFAGGPKGPGYVTYLRRALDAAYRTQNLTCTPGELHVFGDSGWTFGGGSSNIVMHGPVPYGAELARVYRTSAVNLNLTSFQMIEAVNQRVFDAAACGAFVLSDFRRDLIELFEPGAEAVFFRGREEMREMILRYGADRGAREKVARAARSKILARHRWRDRAAEILNRAGLGPAS